MDHDSVKASAGDAQYWKCSLHLQSPWGTIESNKRNDALLIDSLSFIEAWLRSLYVSKRCRCIWFMNKQNHHIYSWITRMRFFRSCIYARFSVDFSRHKKSLKRGISGSRSHDVTWRHRQVMLHISLCVSGRETHWDQPYRSISVLSKVIGKKRISPHMTSNDPKVRWLG